MRDFCPQKGEDPMASQWVDFRELRAKLRFADVLKSYNVQLKIKGDRANGFCPLPGHPRHDGKRHSPSFSANLTKGIFQCFGGGCQAKGNVLDFACYMEGVDPNDAQGLRKVALQLQERFLGNGDDHKAGGDKPAKSAAKRKEDKPDADSEAQQKPSEGSGRKVIVNAPLDFALKALDAEHPYLKQRGFTPETIAHFGLGYCSKGMMAERIAIPLHDATGKLVGYAGRLVDDGKIDDETPKYRFPGNRERNQVVYEFKKSLLLYNGYQIVAPVRDLVVVEGFPSIWWLWQHGYANVVALMGSSCSDEQADLIVNLVTGDGHVWAMSDGDDAGERCAEDVFTHVGAHRFIRWIRLEPGQQPTDCDADALASLLPFDAVEKGGRCP
jgi:DNA primase